MKLLSACALVLAMPLCGSAQMMTGMDGKGAAKEPAKPSTELTLSGLSGASKRLSPAEFKLLPHVVVKVHNAHNNMDESYSGVPVKDLLAMVEPAKGEGPKVSANMLVVVAGATDNFHVVLTRCDTEPECRNGQAIVADTLNGQPLATEGAFKLVLSEDKKPGRWARNLSSLTVRVVTP